jgi:general secretion pathway protein B
MSYILDALRRADAEREQGAVPSLHSKPVPPALADADEGEARGGVPLVGWVAMAGSAVVGAVLVWFFVGRSDAPEPMPQQPAMAAQPAPVAPAPAPAPMAATARPEAAPATPVSPPDATPLPPPAPSRALAAPARAAPPAPASTPVQRAAPEVRTAGTRPAAKAPPPAVDENAVIPSMSELPDDIRRQLPQLTVSGATYSRTASSRMLILNGQIFHEGDKVANDLVLEQIRLKSAVLSFRGTRYSISY